MPLNYQIHSTTETSRDIDTTSESSFDVRGPMSTVISPAHQSHSTTNVFRNVDTASDSNCDVTLQYTPLDPLHAFPNSNSSTKANSRKNSVKNYCYVCQKPQSKLARHLETHKTEAEISQVLSYPKRSAERRLLLEKLRNRGNHEHNLKVMKSGEGQVKLKRSSQQSTQHQHCVFCKGMFSRKELWRHNRRCPFKPKHAMEQGVLSLATTAQSVFSEHISAGVWKLLNPMRQDAVSSVVRNDFGILQLAQSFYNKHGHDQTKYEYIRQKLREVARVVLSLREDGIYSTEDAVKPESFQKVAKAVKSVSGFDEETNSYKTPSLALKIGHSLLKVSEIIHCRALMANNKELMKSTSAFKSLYKSKWCELVSHSALSTQSENKYNKPLTLPFTEDVKKLHSCLENSSQIAFQRLSEKPSPQSYADLAKATLAQIIVFNRRRSGEVSKMRLKDFINRDKNELNPDVALGLTEFEKKLCQHFSRVEIMGKRGRKVAVLLTASMVRSLELLLQHRKDCGVTDDNVFLFAKPKCGSFYRGQDVLRLYSRKCDASFPEHLRSTLLRKQIATLCQVLNLRNNELDQVADFLGHDIRVHHDFYRLPDSTIQLAKISRLLLTMEKGSLENMQGKSLDEIEFQGSLPYTEHFNTFNCNTFNCNCILLKMFVSCEAK